jgi:SAM-dependent methyltransferase
MPQHNRLYDDLAWIWPILSPPEEYEEEVAEVVSLINEHALIETKTLLDLGCGGGHNDFWLKRTFTVTGVDLSESMLALARQLNPEVCYLTGDMRSVQLRETFDVVFIADAIDYLLTEDDLRAAFETAYAHLNPGGVFITYAEETKERFEQNKTKTITRKQGSIELTSIENYYDPDPEDTTYEMTFVYLIREKRKLRVETDHHVMGLFETATWIELLEEAGFEVRMVAYEGVGPMFVGAIRT